MARFDLLAVLLLPLACLLTAGFEARRAPALEFFRTLAHPLPLRWLVLLPAGAIGLVVAAAASLTLLPPLPAVALLGCVWWAVAVGHSFAGRGSAVFLLGAVPLAYGMPNLIGSLAFDAGGWITAAGSTLALGVAGGLVAPRSGFSLRRVAKPAAARPAAHERHHSIGRRDSRSTAVRLFRFPPELVIGSGRLVVIAGCVVAVTYSLIALFKPMLVSYELQLDSWVGPRWAARTLRPAREFFFTRPITRGRLVCATILPWIFLAALPPALGIARVMTMESVSQSDFLSFAHRLSPAEPATSDRDEASSVAAAREPGVGQRHPAPTDRIVSPRLRKQMVKAILHSALLTMVALFACASAVVASESRPRGAWSRIFYALFFISTLLVLAFALDVPLPWGLRSLEFSALLLGTTLILSWRQLSIVRR